MRRALVILMSIAAPAVTRAQPAPTAPPEPPAADAPPPPPQTPPTTTAPVDLALPAQLPATAAATATGPAQPESQRRHAAELICAAHDPSCDWVATFSSLERRSIDRVLAANGYVIDAEPWGKRIAHVDVVTEDVFAEKNWLQFFNIFHYRSRQSRVRQELTIQAGELWDLARVEESARRLHDPLYSSVVALLPIKRADGQVDLLVVTRDIWSLRLNSQYTFQQSALTNLAVSLSENNFFGTRDVVAVGLVMDQGAIALGPLFLDKDFLGQHLNLSIQVNDIITREAGKMFDPATMTLAPIVGDPKGIEDAGTLHSEGENASVSLSRPLWSLATEWGAGASFSYSNSVVRSFTGVHGDAFELYTDPDSGLPYEFRYKTWSTSASVVRQWGTDYKSQLAFGYTVASQSPSLLPSFSSAEASAAAQFAADVFPRTEVISEPYVSYSLFQPSYRVLRDVGTYELAEDVQFGPNATATVAQGLAALGGTATFTRPSLALAWTWPWGHDGYVRPSTAASVRLQGGVENNWQTIDNSGDVAVRAVTPTLDYVRIVANAEVDTDWHNTQNQYFAIGSDSGLRGYNVNQFRSPRGANARRVTGEVEVRTIPVPWWVLRAGAVAFYEVGGATSSLSDMQLYNDFGVGLRLLIPQFNRDVARIDVAFPLQGAPNNPALYPHFIAGFASYF